MGPHLVPIHEGFRYFLSIVDVATRCTQVYLMIFKLEVRCCGCNGRGVQLDQVDQGREKKMESPPSTSLGTIY